MKTSFLDSRRNVVLTSIALAVVTVAVILAVVLTMGRTATLSFNVAPLLANDATLTAEDIVVLVEEDTTAVRETDRVLAGSTLNVTFTSVERGRVYVSCDSGDGTSSGMHQLNVLPGGVITQESYFGTCRGGRILPVMLALYLAYVLFLFIRAFRRNMKECMYQYKNIAFRGACIYLVFLILQQLSQLRTFAGLVGSVSSFIESFSTFAILTFPIALITAVLVTISNIVLVKNEGKSLHNLLGVFLGLLVIVGVLLPGIINNRCSSMSTA